MTHARRLLCLGAVIASLSTAGPAAADAYGRFQHGGRATGQAGAFLARAADPSAVAYNPAAIVRLEGLQAQAGLDFEAPTDEFESAAGDSKARHSIQFPPAAYLTWKPAGARWAVGAGVDSPLWRLIEWDNALFPGRFVARRSETTLFAARAVAALAVDEHWSVGGGLRYLTGTSGYGDTVTATESGAAGPVGFEVDRRAEVSADGLGLDLAVHYSTARWGFGATYASATEVEGKGDVEFQVRDLAALPADVQAAALARFPRADVRLAEDLPEQLAAGFWIAPYPELRLELDLALARWSAASSSVGAEGAVVAITRRNGWRDTLSIRFGLEGDLPDPRWRLGAGVAIEPTPARPGAAEPGAARGDALVYALGASFDLDARLSFDLGYSYHDFDALTGERQLQPAGGAATYEARAQLFSVSARWRF